MCLNAKVKQFENRIGSLSGKVLHDGSDSNKRHSNHFPKRQCENIADKKFPQNPSAIFFKKIIPKSFSRPNQAWTVTIFQWG